MNDSISQEPLSKLATNLWAFRTLITGLKLDIFEHTKVKSSVGEIANKLNLNPDPVERLLNVFVSMDLLEKNNEDYINLPISNKFLLKDVPTYYGDFLLMFAESDDNWKELEESIIENKPIIKNHNNRLSKPFFTRAMHSNARGPANKVSELFDFTNKTYLLDIGAGAGTFSIVMTNKYPNLKATTIEQKPVCQIIEKYVNKEANPEKINIVGGDFFKVDFPKHDIALFGQIFHSNSIEENKLLLKKVFDKIENDGILIITEFLLNEDKTGPLFSSLFAINMFHQTESGNTYTFSQIKSWLEEIGFKNIGMKHLIGPHSAIFANK